MSYGKEFLENEDFIELEEEFCYDESYSYNKKRDISIINWDYEGILFFKWFKVEYKKGNVCDYEYLLEEEYIYRFIKEAKIKYNNNNIDLGKLIEDKKAIVGNIRYPYDDNNKHIGYVYNFRL